MNNMKSSCLVFQYFDFFIYFILGTHWVYNIVHMLRNKTNTLYGTPEFLDLVPMDIINKRKSPRVFASHLPCKYLPEDLRLHKGKIIVTYRNPKDICVSMFTFFNSMGPKMNPYRGDWDGFVNLFLQGNGKNDVFCLLFYYFKGSMSDKKSIKSILFNTFLRLYNFGYFCNSFLFWFKMSFKFLCTLTSLRYFHFVEEIL